MVNYKKGQTVRYKPVGGMLLFFPHSQPSTPVSGSP